MYKVDKKNNRAQKIQSTSFKQLGFKERTHLQEWIADNPSLLNEELLIIQKEYDGFFDTNERLDLLALDKEGNLVIIENKLDDTGKDVTWQALKYASYCSSLKTDEIVGVFQEYLDKRKAKDKAEDILVEFFNSEDYIERLGNSTQRIILIAKEFRKEVTSTVLWLLNKGLNIKCLKVCPYEIGDQPIITVEQIIPIKEAEEYIIRRAYKLQDDLDNRQILENRHHFRLEFWKKMLRELNKVSSLFSGVSPSKNNILDAGSGLSSVAYSCQVTKNYVRVEISINWGEKEENKTIFDALKTAQSQIEKVFGNSLMWNRLDDGKISRIQFDKKGLNLYNKEDWNEMIDFFVINIPKLEAAFKDYILQIKDQVKDIKGILNIIKAFKPVQRKKVFLLDSKQN